MKRRMYFLTPLIATGALIYFGATAMPQRLAFKTPGSRCPRQER